MRGISAEYQSVDATRKKYKINLSYIIPTDVNKTGDLPEEFEILVEAKITVRSDIDA